MGWLKKLFSGDASAKGGDDSLDLVHTSVKSGDVDSKSGDVERKIVHTLGGGGDGEQLATAPDQEGGDSGLPKATKGAARRVNRKKYVQHKGRCVRLKLTRNSYRRLRLLAESSGMKLSKYVVGVASDLVASGNTDSMLKLMEMLDAQFKTDVSGTKIYNVWLPERIYDLLQIRFDGLFCRLRVPVPRVLAVALRASVLISDVQKDTAPFEPGIGDGFSSVFEGD